MIRLLCLAFVSTICLSCNNNGPDTPPEGVESTKNFATERVKFKAKFKSAGGPGDPVDIPPPSAFKLDKFKSPVGELATYITPAPKEKMGAAKKPAIIWITGGDCNSIGECWNPKPESNDQTAGVYRQKGIVMMFPSLRGGNKNPGKKEGFFGEIDDVLASLEYLKKCDYVDPKRIYLGGHSTGGTLVFLVAEATDQFRAVFSFGPADNVSAYPDEFTPFDRTDRAQVFFRSPINWMDSVKSPLFVFEGTNQGNIGSLKAMKSASKNPLIQFFPVPGKTHFSVLAPVNRIIADKILKDTGEKCNIAFTEAELK